jgi:hypothetical protein
LARFGSGTALRLLREQRLDPGAVDEVAGAREAGEEEDVEEEAGTGISGEIKGIGEKNIGENRGSYIWGSKIEMGASTTLTVPLNAST